MWHRILPLLAAALMLTGCAFGSKHAKAERPNLSIPQGSMALCPEELTGDPQQGKPEQLLQAYVEDGSTYHTCRINHKALVKAMCEQKGVTINGVEPASLCK